MYSPVYTAIHSFRYCGLAFVRIMILWVGKCWEISAVFKVLFNARGNKGDVISCSVM